MINVSSALANCTADSALARLYAYLASAMDYTRLQRFGQRMIVMTVLAHTRPADRPRLYDRVGPMRI